MVSHFMILFHWGNLVECLFLLSLDFETIHEANLSAFDDPKEYEDAPHMTSFKESMHYWKAPPQLDKALHDVYHFPLG